MQARWISCGSLSGRRDAQRASRSWPLSIQLHLSLKATENTYVADNSTRESVVVHVPNLYGRPKIEPAEVERIALPIL